MKHKCFYKAVSKWLNVVLPDVGADSSHISDMTAEKSAFYLQFTQNLRGRSSMFAHIIVVS